MSCLVGMRVWRTATRMVWGRGVGWVLGLVVGLAWAEALLAHEYWLEVTPAGEVRMFVGEALRAEEERPFQAKKTLRCELYCGGSGIDLLPTMIEGATPFAKLQPEQWGSYTFVTDRDWSTIELAAAEFEEYLKHEGLDSIVRHRAECGETEKPARERYARCLKLLMDHDQFDGNQSEPGPLDGIRLNNGPRHWIAKAMAGQALEIVPIGSPFDRLGETARFQVFFEGQYLKNHVVFADNRLGDEVKTVRLETDEEGLVSVPVDREGLWLIRLVHMRRCEDADAGVDWESYWGALTFNLQPADMSPCN